MAVRKKSVPLREWMESEAKLVAATHDGGKVLINSMKHKHQMIIRKVTVAYGISEILRHLSDIHQGAGAAATALGDAALPVATTVTSSSSSRETINCSIDNFSVRVSEKEKTVPANICQGGNAMTTQVNIEGVDILSPEISLKITEPSFLSDMYQDQMGRYLEVEILNKLLPTSAASSSGPGAAVAHENFDENSATLYSFGRLLYELFSHIDTSQVEAFLKEGKANNNSSNRGGNDMICQEPSRKKRASAYKAITEQGEAASPSPPTASQYMPLQELGFPSSLSLLVQNLLECQSQAKDAYDNLQSSPPLSHCWCKIYLNVDCKQRMHTIICNLLRPIYISCCWSLIGSFSIGSARRITTGRFRSKLGRRSCTAGRRKWLKFKRRFVACPLVRVKHSS